MGVQVSSLYNHIEGQSDLMAEVGICAVNMLTGLEEASIADKLRDEALFSLANISDYGIEGKRQIHYQRLLSVMHGFFAHENSGGFSVSDIDKDASYRFSIECVAIRMKAEEDVIHENR